jgi:hypothetical protein
VACVCRLLTRRRFARRCGSVRPRLREVTSLLSIRVGARPRTTPTKPHARLDRQPTDLRWAGVLAERVFALSVASRSPAASPSPGARALVLAGRSGLVGEVCVQRS